MAIRTSSVLALILLATCLFLPCLSAAQAQSALPAPTNVVATFQTATTVQLTWDFSGPSSNVAFGVWLNPCSLVPHDSCSPGTPPSITPQGARSYIFTDARPGDCFVLTAVYADKSGPASVYSNLACATARAQQSQLPAPTNVVATFQTATTAQISWDFSGPITNVVFGVWTNPCSLVSNPNNCSPGAGPSTTATSVHSYVVNGAKSGDCFAVTAIYTDRSGPASGFSNLACAGASSSSSNPDTSTSGVTPVIAYVPPFLNRSYFANGPQFSIFGSGFGDLPSYNGFDGDSPYIQVTDKTKGWSAGCGSRGDCNPDNSVHLNYLNWTDSRIDVFGFTGDYGTDGKTFATGDTVVIQLWNPQSGINSGWQTTSVVDQIPWSGGNTEIQDQAFGCLKDLGLIAGTGGVIAGLTITAGQVTRDMLLPDTNPLKQDLKLIQDANPGQGVIDCYNVYKFLGG